MKFEAGDEFEWFFRAVPIAGIIAGLVYFLMQPPPPPDPANATVFGCYAAPDSPPILLDGTGMHVRQAGYPVIPFHLELS